MGSFVLFSLVNHQGTVLSLAAGIVSAMSHLHERNIIHGDLNPANVLLKSPRSTSLAAKSPADGETLQ